MKVKMNDVYKKDIKKAKKFMAEEAIDNRLFIFMSGLKTSSKSHSEKWAEIYDFLYLHYPDYTDLATGLTYYIEEE